MTFMDKIREFIRDICREVLCDLDRADPIEDYQLEEWLDNNAKFRELKDYVTGVEAESNRNMNMRVDDLLGILSGVDDKMQVVIPVLDADDHRVIHDFRYVRTAGIISSKYEREDALCLSAAGESFLIDGQLKYNNMESQTVCKKVLF